MDLDQFMQIWQGLSEGSREQIRREIYSPEVMERAARVRAARI